MTERHRPTGVPAQAVWVEDESEWELGPRDPEGERDGAFRVWRADGSLASECRFRHGRPDGPFRRFHESGEVAQEGEFVDGKLHGTRRWFAATGETTESTLAPGMSAAIVRSEMDYEMDRVVATRHYDAKDRRVLPLSGDPYPERPSGVPAEAELREKEGRWMHGLL